MSSFVYPEINKIFDELEYYREFCVEFGYVFREEDLLNFKSPYAQFDRYRRGQRVTNMWKEDAKRSAQEQS
jgi:hypothetical protein